jgi:hypothetical protein
MQFDSESLGAQRLSTYDEDDQGSRYADVRHALFSSAYYRVWRGPGERPLPVYGVTLRRLLRGLTAGGRGWDFLQAARRTVASGADLRWGMKGRGFRRLLHPNAVCLFGRWTVDQPTHYSGAFSTGAQHLIVARYSTCCTEVRRGRWRSLSMVGKLYPTTDENHPSPLRTANFITQEDIGGAKSRYINEAVLRNAPDVTPWRRGWGLPGLLATGAAFRRADREPTIRQLHSLAELGKPATAPTKTPIVMQLRVSAGQPERDEVDFRDEVLAQLYDSGDPEPKRSLAFDIEVADRMAVSGRFKRRIRVDDWTRIGRIEFHEAVASFNGDFVLHFQHPAWRSDPNDPSTVTGPSR